MKEKGNLLKSAPVVCLLAAVSCVLWGSAFPAIKTGYKLLNIAANDYASQILFAGIRFTLSGIMTVTAVSIFRRKLLLPRRSAVPKIMLVSFFQTILQYFFFYIGLAGTTGTKSSVITATNIFFAVILSCVVFRLEKLTVGKAIGCVIGFCAVIIINLRGLDLNFSLTGDGFVLIAAISSALSSVIIKLVAKSEDPILISGWQFLMGGLVLMGGGAAAGGKIGTFDISAVLLLIYLGFLSAAAYGIWSVLLKHNPVSKVAVYGFINPVCGMILSAVILGEELASAETVIASLLACVGIVIVNTDFKNIGKKRTE